jgi:DNA-directed RNA polymerase subunit beta'
MQDGSLRFDDINYFYRNLALVNDKLKNPIKELPEGEYQPLREQMYDLTKSLAGTGGKPVYESSRKLKGILDTIAGDQPKMGYFQRRLVRRRQDLSMRSTIVPEPQMHLDYVGVPKTAAMELYKPFVVREMQTMGYNPVQSLKEIKDGSDISWKALQKAMDQRPIMLKRDPSLHKFSIMAFKPKLVEGKAIKIHPLVCAGYNADFDGDTMSAFVPLTDDAVREAHKMFPSNNLFSSTTGGVMYAPQHESLLGLHMLSKWGKESGKSFPTYQEALRAKERGVITPNDVIAVAGKKTTLGRLIIAEHLPEDLKKGENFAKMLQSPDFALVKRAKTPNQLGVTNLLDQIAHNDPKNFAMTVDRLKELGNQYSYELGASIGLSDLRGNTKIRDDVMKKYDSEAVKVNASKSSKIDKDQKLVDIYTRATDELVSAHKDHFQKTDNRLYTMVASGARGDMSQFRQMTIAPMLMQDANNNTIPHPVKRSYSEGLDVGDYWMTMHGARKGTIQRAAGTSEPGRISKEIVNVSIPNLIVSRDCGTNQGISMGIVDDDVHDRVLAVPVKVNGKLVAKAGDMVTPNLTSLLKQHKIDKVVVRSPLKCAHGQGLCAKCFGLNENGHFHEVGTNIGVIAGQAMGEPATQLAMDSFHTGGVASSRGGGSVDKFTRLNQLLEIPKILPNSATLSRISGKVQKVERDQATNGWNVHIGGEKHFIPAQRQLAVKVGGEVKKGDPLSDGPINPHHLLDLTDIHNVQNYLTHELYHGLYKDERVRRRNIETVIRSLTNLARVKDPGSSEHTYGDVVLRSVLDEHNRSLKSGENPVTYHPLLRSARQTALDQHEDWMARLNFQQLHNTILEGAARGWKTDLHGIHPVPAYVHGTEFGKGTKDKPHYY